MRKLYLQLSEDINSYWSLEKINSLNFDLYHLWESFDYTNEWIEIDEEEDMISIWDSWDIKDKKSKKYSDFVSLESKKEHDSDYRAYCLKRWKDMPIVEITKKNYEQILQQWQKVKTRKYTYVVVAIDNKGLFWIEGRSKLYVDDWEYIKEDHQRYLNFKEKYDAYEKFRKKKNKEWESEADSEYYSDYLTEEEMVWKKKKF